MGGRAPQDEQSLIDGMTVLAEVELQRYRTGAAVRDKLRALIAPGLRDGLDAELAKLTQGP